MLTPSLAAKASPGATFEMDLKQLWSENARLALQVDRHAVHPDSPGYQHGSGPILSCKHKLDGMGTFKSRTDAVGVTRDYTLTLDFATLSGYHVQPWPKSARCYIPAKTRNDIIDGFGTGEANRTTFPVTNTSKQQTLLSANSRRQKWSSYHDKFYLGDCFQELTQLEPGYQPERDVSYEFLPWDRCLKITIQADCSEPTAAELEASNTGQSSMGPISRQC